MRIKRHKAVPGGDYDPITGEFSNISYGVIEAGDALPRRRLEDVVAKRCFPTERPTKLDGTWPESTAYRKPEVLLTKGAPEHLSDPALLCAAYHSKPGDQIQHLAANITIRFQQVDEVPQRLRLHEAIELSRGFGLHLARSLKGAAVFCFHVPSSSWGHGPPHAHLIVPLRTVKSGSGFSRFIMELIKPAEGRKYVDSAWRAWIHANEYEL